LIRQLDGKEFEPQAHHDNWEFYVLDRIEYRGKPAILGNVVETTQRKKMEESLQESEKALRLLSSQLMMAQENERKWIARELHDSIGQTLTAVKFSLERKLSQMNPGKAPPGISLEDVLAMLQGGIEETRRIMTHLRPSLLDDLGIIATLNWICRGICRQPSRRIHLFPAWDLSVGEKSSLILLVPANQK
jgi:signal transduction histidine kinase